MAKHLVTNEMKDQMRLMYINGKTAKEIALNFNLNINTVKTHCCGIKRIRIQLNSKQQKHITISDSLIKCCKINKKAAYEFSKIEKGQKIHLEYKKSKGKYGKELNSIRLKIKDGIVIQKTDKLIIVQDAERSYIRSDIKLSDLISKTIQIVEVVA